MSTGILLTGKRGQGKSLAAVGRIREYLINGRRVATNLDIFIENMFSPMRKGFEVYRIPDYPNTHDLSLLPLGNDKLYLDDNGDIKTLSGYTDEENGILVLDECASFMNARDWNNTDEIEVNGIKWRVKDQRAAINDWFRHSRKYGWDLLFLVQHEDLIDKQNRSALFEMWGLCKRLDRIAIPLITPFFKIFSMRVMPPKIHVATIRYGFSADSPVSDRWVYRGVELYNCYDTTQVIGGSNVGGVCSLLSPWYLKGRYFSKTRRFLMASKIVLIALSFGAAGGFLLSKFYYDKPKIIESKTPISAPEKIDTQNVYVVGYALVSGVAVAYLSDGRSISSFDYTLKGDLFSITVDGITYWMNK